jgi:integrase/recombinase XerD
MPEFRCGLFKKSAVTVTSINCSATLDVKPDQVKGAIASHSMLSYTGNEHFPPVEDELPAVPCPLTTCHNCHKTYQTSEPEEIPDW